MKRRVTRRARRVRRPEEEPTDEEVVASLRAASLRNPRLWTALGFAGGVVVGLLVWSDQTRRYRRNLFSARRWRRLAALGHIRGQRSVANVHLLRDYVTWEQHPGLRRRGRMILRSMEESLE